MKMRNQQFIKYTNPSAFSVVIPVYNEAKRIEEGLKKILNFFNDNQFDYEIIIVDDGSTDQTVKIIKEFCCPRIRILQHSKNKGKGAAVKTGALAAQKNFILITDIDLSTPIEELYKLIPYLKNYDIVIASRGVREAQIIQRQPFYKELLGRLGNLLVQILLLPGIKDTQCGFKLFKKKVQKIFQKLTINSWGFDMEMLFLAKRAGLKIKEVGVIWENNPSSKVKLIDYAKVLYDLFKIKINKLLLKY